VEYILLVINPHDHTISINCDGPYTSVSRGDTVSMYFPALTGWWLAALEDPVDRTEHIRPLDYPSSYHYNLVIIIFPTISTIWWNILWRYHRLLLFSSSSGMGVLGAVLSEMGQCLPWYVSPLESSSSSLVGTDKDLWLELRFRCSWPWWRRWFGNYCFLREKYSGIYVGYRTTWRAKMMILVRLRIRQYDTTIDYQRNNKTINVNINITAINFCCATARNFVIESKVVLWKRRLCGWVSTWVN